MSRSVAEVAELMSVSPRRVLQWIGSGSMRAVKIGGVYVVEDSELGRRRMRCRPLSVDMAWGLVDVLSGGEPDGFGATERWRLRQYAARLGGDPDPAGLLASWLRGRAERVILEARPGVAGSLRGDPRLAVSGVSDSRGGLSASHQAEGYVRPVDFDGLVRDYLLLRSDKGNVVLHVTERIVVAPVPVGLVMADLADYGLPREDAVVERMLKEGDWL